MQYFIYRNTTLENVFGSDGFEYSGYLDITPPRNDVDAYVWFYILSVDKGRSQLLEEIDAFHSFFRFVLENCSYSKPVFAFTLHQFNPLQYELIDYSLQERITNFNGYLYGLMNQYPNLKVLDIADFTQKYNVHDLIDWKFYFHAGIVINPKLSQSLKEWFLKVVSKFQSVRKKCLVLDLDHTLWYGILGEGGARVDGDYPANAFAYFQKQLLELARTGVMLSVCSKNNEQEVLQFWRNNPQMNLQLEHIVAYRINWENKVDNIRQLAEELNIGLDSMVFVDDNPTERELVRCFLPEVEVPEFPDKPYLLPMFYDQLLSSYFLVARLTKEDKDKVNQYQIRAAHMQALTSYSSLADFYQSLELKMSVDKVDASTLSRAAQMTQKTNQFNLTTRRYTESDIAALISGDAEVLCLSVEDRFGDSGIVGLAILVQESVGVVLIETFLLSCRVLGKEVECEFLNHILMRLKNRGIDCVKAEYIKTQKNGQTQDFYDKSGFALVEEINDVKSYELFLRDFEIKKVNHIEVIQDER